MSSWKISPSKLHRDSVEHIVAEEAFELVRLDYGNKDRDCEAVLERLQKGLASKIDFVRIIERRSNNGKYDSICW